MILMTNDPTNAHLEKKIEILEQELDELQTKIERLLKIEGACKELAQKIANERGDPLADWWWPV